MTESQAEAEKKSQAAEEATEEAAEEESHGTCVGKTDEWALMPPSSLMSEQSAAERLEPSLEERGPGVRQA